MRSRRSIYGAQCHAAPRMQNHGHGVTVIREQYPQVEVNYGHPYRS
jgi:hypothetical protein